MDGLKKIHCKYCHHLFYGGTCYDFSLKVYICPICEHKHHEKDLSFIEEEHDKDVYGYEKE